MVKFSTMTDKQPYQELMNEGDWRMAGDIAEQQEVEDALFGR